MACQFRIYCQRRPWNAGCRWESAGAFSICRGDVRAHKDHGVEIGVGRLVSVSVFVFISSYEVLLLLFFSFSIVAVFQSARKKAESYDLLLAGTARDDRVLLPEGKWGT